MSILVGPVIFCKLGFADDEMVALNDVERQRNLDVEEAVASRAICRKGRLEEGDLSLSEDDLCEEQDEIIKWSGGIAMSQNVLFDFTSSFLNKVFAFCLRSSRLSSSSCVDFPLRQSERQLSHHSNHFKR